LKTCATCKKVKSLTEFSADRRRSDGKLSQCRRCQLDAKKLKRSLNKRKAVDYLGGKCKRCSLESSCLDVFDFHHRNPDEKENSLNLLVNKDWSKMQPELDKCDLLCSNYHKITHWEIRNKINKKD
jgi:hypothetical protein